MNRVIKFLSFCVLSGISVAFGQSGPGFSGTKTTWKGFARYDFQFQGRDCRVVCPDKPASGNPWIWNARFPDWHTDIDETVNGEALSSRRKPGPRSIAHISSEALNPITGISKCYAQQTDPGTDFSTGKTDWIDYRKWGTDVHSTVLDIHQGM